MVVCMNKEMQRDVLRAHQMMVDVTMHPCMNKEMRRDVLRCRDIAYGIVSVVR